MAMRPCLELLRQRYRCSTCQNGRGQLHPMALQGRQHPPPNLYSLEDLLKYVHRRSQQ